MLSILALPAFAEHARWDTLEQSAEQAFMAGETEPAERYWADALSEAEKADPQGLDVATTLNQRMHLHMKQRSYAAARADCERALAIREKLMPEGVLTAQTMSNLALICHKLGEDGRAEELYGRAITIKEKALGKDAPELAVTMHNLANLMSDHGHVADATRLYRRAIEIDRRALGGDHLELSRDLASLGIHQYKSGQPAEAARTLAEALGVAERCDDKSELVPVLHYLALCEARLQHPDKARVYNERVLALAEGKNGKGHHANTVHRLNIARNADDMGKAADAEKLYLSTLADAEAGLPASMYQLAECRIELAHFYRRHGRMQEADDSYAKALSAYDKLSDADKVRLYELPSAYSDLLKDLKRDNESKAMAERYLHVHQRKVK